MPGDLDHGAWMTRALELAGRGDYHTSPNPMVGAVVVDEAGSFAGEGFHERPGAPHGEAAALEAAGARARGGTVYVTLEPCSFAGRTPPCADALIAAGVRRVVVAMEDPDPRVRGRGLARLREAGIEVVVGPGMDQARRLNEFYVKHRETGRPFVTLKWAMSLDGRIATAGGESQWISGPQARAHVHGLRHRYDAILVGVNTVLADDPRLTTRIEGRPDARNPARIVLDRGLRTPVEAAVLPATIFTAPGPEADRVLALEQAGAEVLPVGTDPADVLDELGRRDLLSLMVEGGSEVLWSYVPFADRVLAYVAPFVLGGRSARPAVGGDGFDLAGAIRLEGLAATAVGPDILLEGDVHRDRQ